MTTATDAPTLTTAEIVAAFRATHERRAPQINEWTVAQRLSQLLQDRAWETTGQLSFISLTRSLGFSGKRATQMVQTWQAWSSVDATLLQKAVKTISFRKAARLVPLLKDRDLHRWLDSAVQLSLKELIDIVQEHLSQQSKQPQQVPASTPANTKNWQLPCPDPNFFVHPEHWRQLCFAGVHGQNALLIGHSGTGKTELLDLAATALNRPCFVINFGATSEPRTALLGATHFNSSTGTWFAESAFLRAVQTPYTLIILDELSRCRPEAYNIILPLLDGQRTVAVDERSDSPVLELATGVSFMATANIGLQYSGTETLDHALLDRFSVVLEIGFPPAPREQQLLIVRTGVQPQFAEVLVKLANDQRSMTAEGTFLSPLSTRTLLAAAFQTARGIPIREAVNACMSARFSSEGGNASERSQFQTLLQKYLGKG